MKYDTGLFEWYDNGEPRTRNRLVDVWENIFWHSPLAPVLEKCLGELWHEKLGRAPNFGYLPQITEPRTFNEKILHRKLFTDEELYTKVADKWAVREYVEEKVGGEILNEVYHVTDDPNTIPFEDLPGQFAVKTTHGSGWNILVEDKREVDFDEITAQCNRWLSADLSEVYKEYWYSDISPKVTVEKYIEDGQRDTPMDFCFFVFHGQTRYIKVDYNHVSPETNRIYDRDWNPQTFRHVRPLGPHLERPPRLEEMIDIADTLGEDFDFARIDLYAPNPEDIIFGEITLSPYAGGGPFYPRVYDFEFGSYW